MIIMWCMEGGFGQGFFWKHSVVFRCLADELCVQELAEYIAAEAACCNSRTSSVFSREKVSKIGQVISRIGSFLQSRRCEWLEAT